MGGPLIPSYKVGLQRALNERFLLSSETEGKCSPNLLLF